MLIGVTLGLQRWQAAATLQPDPMSWAMGFFLLMLYAAIAIPLGFYTQLLTWKVVKDPVAIATTLGIAFVFPAIVEESLFRVFLLPSPLNPQFYLWAGISLVLFIAAHPLNALIFFPHRKATFFDPTFLILAGLLGLVCTVAYAVSGSLWIPVVLHWVPVVIWLLLLGGSDRMNPGEHP